MCVGGGRSVGPMESFHHSQTGPASDVRRGSCKKEPLLSHVVVLAPAGHPDRERGLQLLIRRLPQRLQGVVRWLRQPSARWLRVPSGLLLIVGGVFSILPVLGLWMLPLGLVLLAEDVPPLRRGTDRVLGWIERRRPHWMGLSSGSSPPGKESRHGYRLRNG